MKGSFIFYRSFQDAIDNCPIEEQLSLYKAITKYALDRIEPSFRGIKQVVWVLIKPQLDANWKRYESGLKGGAPKGNKNNRFSKDTTKVQPKYNQDTTKVQPNVNVNVFNDNVIKENITKKATLSLSERQKKFKEELQVYTDKYGRDMIFAFYDYWSEPNQPNTKMKLELQKTWSLAGRLRTWERRSNGK